MIEEIDRIDKSKEKVFISGFGGTGNVAYLTTKILAEKLNAKLVAKVYNDDFPPIITIDGKNAELTHGRIFIKDNLVIFSCEYQPNIPYYQFELSKEIVDFAVSINAKHFFSLGAMILDFLNENPSIYYSTNSEKWESVLSKMNFKKNERFSTIIGCNGLVYVYGVKNNLESVIMLADTFRFFQYDYNAASALLKASSEILNFKIDLSDVEKILEAQKRDYKSFVEGFSRERKSSLEEKEKLSYIG